jgi:hypothetical protein
MQRLYQGMTSVVPTDTPLLYQGMTSVVPTATEKD